MDASLPEDERAVVPATVVSRGGDRKASDHAIVMGASLSFFETKVRGSAPTCVRGGDEAPFEGERGVTRL